MALRNATSLRAAVLIALGLTGCSSTEDGEEDACSEEPCLEAPALAFNSGRSELPSSLALVT